MIKHVKLVGDEIQYMGYPVAVLQSVEYTPVSMREAFRDLLVEPLRKPEQPPQTSQPEEQP